MWSSPRLLFGGIGAGFAPIGAGNQAELVAVPGIDREIRDLIRRMSKENPLRGAPRIHGESVLVRTSFAKRAYKDAI
jgi:hypothetical protein